MNAAVAILRPTLVVLVTCTAQTQIADVAHAAKPNIIMLLADDMGYRDLSCFDSPAVRTLNIDRLADESELVTSMKDALATWLAEDRIQ